ncbi:GNAT family N-acetyltransferase [Polyangium aurulentum]|uniref:GNAT family N-acetyltransferase n=1 Tax=Polyangium aurulentum TaxID=2567896 RepID=UPI0010AE61BF|nr:GNAT family N-acetyltransferase [Polyangium aurulentum]UQA58061.1 GNAT family N-acetyltransferase [Polyangium aurulentum]
MIESTTPEIRIGDRRVGQGAPCFVIAEAGSNHNGSLEQAYRLIDLAAEAGADAVKFQIFRAAALYPPTAGKSDYLGDERNIFDIIRAMEMPPEWLPKLAEHARRAKIAFMASAFDEASVDMLDPFVDAFKVASYEMTHTPLLQHTARKGKPLVFSTGTATLSEVGEAIEAVRATGNEAMIVLQCTAAYPAPLESIDALSMVTMRELFGVPTGLSDHSRDPIAAPMTAVALGAAVIEKHYTLSNRLPGPDHPFALEPHELFEMIRRIREVERTLGTGRKEVHAVEEELRGFARRTVFTSRPIRAGEALSPENTVILRAGKLSHGMPPRDYPAAIGRAFKRSLDAYQPVRAEDLEAPSAEAPPQAISLRPARADDAGRIWVWNNEPSVRRASLRTASIPWADHRAWYAARLQDGATAFWIVQTPEDGAIGSVRIQPSGEEDTISIALAPGARGRGVGTRAIAEAVARRLAAGGARPIVALIRPDNEASARAFARAGFVAEGRREAEGVTVDAYVLRSATRDRG